MPPSAGTSVVRRDHAAWLLAAAVWLIGFQIVFYAQTLPNNAPLTRRELLQNLPFLWMDVFDPPRDESDARSALPPAMTGKSAARPASPGLQNLLQRLDLWLTAAGIVFSAYMCGRLQLRGLGALKPLDQFAVFGLGTSLGLATISTITLLFGLAGCLRCELFLAIGAAIVATEFWLMYSTGSRGSESSSSYTGVTSDTGTKGSTASRETRKSSMTASTRISFTAWGQLLLITGGCAVLALIALGAALPSVEFDVNAYHFVGPKEYFAAGRISMLPHNVYTNFPFLTEMLALLGMVLRGDWYRGALVGKCVLAMFGPITAALVYCIATRLHSKTAGYLAASIHLGIPWTYRISTAAYAEGGLSCYVAAATFCMLLLQRGSPDAIAESPNAADDRAAASPLRPVPFPPVPLLSALFLIAVTAGAAMACKYTGLVSVTIPAVLMATVAIWRFTCAGSDTPGSSAAGSSAAGIMTAGAPRMVTGILVIAAGLMISIGPWLAKNLYETGNPVYPLGWSVFGGIDWSAADNAKWRAGHSPSEHSLFGLFDGMFDVSVRNDWLSACVYSFALLAVVVPDLRRRCRWLLLYAGFLYLQWWLLTHRIDRFWVPMLPVLSAIAGCGAVWCLGRPACDDNTAANAPLLRDSSISSTSFANWVLSGVTVCTLCLGWSFNTWFMTSRLAGFNEFFADENTARQTAIAVTAPMIGTLNESLPAGSKVLLVGEAQVFDATFPLLYNTVFDESLLRQISHSTGLGNRFDSKKSRRLSPAELRGALRSAGITHIAVNWSELLRYRTTYKYDDFVTPELFASWQRNDVLLPAIADPAALRAVEGMDKSRRSELEGWGHALIQYIGPKREAVWPSWQVFPVSR